jgi:hypothetical protein
MNDQRTTAAKLALPSRGWLITFTFLGVVMALDGIASLVGGGLAPAALAEAAGKVLGGPLMASYGAFGLRGIRAPEGKGIEALAILALCLYVGGEVAGSAWWASVVG